MYSATNPTTFASQYTTELKARFAEELKEKPTHTTRTDVSVDTLLEKDDTRIETTADIVLYEGGTPVSVTDIVLTPGYTPQQPTTLDIAQMYAHLNGLHERTDTLPVGVIFSSPIQRGTLSRIPVEFDPALWDNMYKLVLLDSTPRQ